MDVIPVSHEFFGAILPRRLATAPSALVLLEWVNWKAVGDEFGHLAIDRGVEHIFRNLDVIPGDAAVGHPQLTVVALSLWGDHADAVRLSTRAIDTIGSRPLEVVPGHALDIRLVAGVAASNEFPTATAALLAFEATRRLGWAAGERRL